MNHWRSSWGAAQQCGNYASLRIIKHGHDQHDESRQDTDVKSKRKLNVHEANASMYTIVGLNIVST